MSEPGISERMRADWNRRARQDAGYFVAFGRRDQDDAEFFATAAGVIHNFTRELRWFPRRPGDRGGRALEIGCGPGRLMRPVCAWFEEVHGVDVSDEMIRLGREKLRDVPNAHFHLSSGAGLEEFEDGSFDFVYSYAVFQHIPSREVVFRYIDEALRVLRPGGLLRCQLNGLPETATEYDTWHGVRVGEDEVREFAGRRDVLLLAVEGALTQYMWVTMRKRVEGALPPAPPAASIRRVANPCTSEPLVPAAGRFASVSLGMEDLPAECNLLGLESSIGGIPAKAYYVGPPDLQGWQQINVELPEGIRPGLAIVRLAWRGEPLCPAKAIRVIPPAPAIPRVISVTDGVDLLAGTRIASKFIKVTLEEAGRPDELVALLDGEPLTAIDIFCTDPAPPRCEVNLRLPDSVVAGPHIIEMRLGRRRFAPVSIEVDPR
jgi:SAM-dependent methyltransferase